VISRIHRVGTDADSPSMVMAAPRRSRLATMLLPLLAAGGPAAGAVATTAGFHQYTAVGCATAIAVLLAAVGYIYRRGRRELAVVLAQLEHASTVESAEAARSSVAAGLHDGPIQRLTATAFTLDLLTNALGRGDLAAANDLALRIRDQLGTEMTSLRQLMNELRTPVPAILPSNTAWRPQPAEVGYAPV